MIWRDINHLKRQSLTIVKLKTLQRCVFKRINSQFHVSQGPLQPIGARYFPSRLNSANEERARIGLRSTKSYEVQYKVTAHCAFCSEHKSIIIKREIQF